MSTSETMRPAILVTVLLAAMLTVAGPVSPFASSKKEVAAYRAAVNARFDDWVKQLRAEAEQRGIRTATFDAAMQGVRPDWSLKDLDPPELGPGQPPKPRVEETSRRKQQPEFDRPAKYFPPNGLAYVTKLGRQYRDRWKETLAAIEQQFQVEPHVVLAIWGRETAFGRAELPYYAIEALATQAFIGRRPEKFREELLLALKILAGGHVSRARMKSSWAGAMGHTQFLPSDFHKYAVDFDGDGKRDIWGTIPDALASTANFLKSNGWEHGKTWGYEVNLPDGFDCTLEGETHERPIGEWVNLGVKRTYGRDFPEERLIENAYLVAPAGTLGPAFLVMENFAVFRTYNKADLYALYVGHVADRIAFGGDFATDWRRVESFTRHEMKRLQLAVAQAGIEVGKIDGLLGTKTRSAIGQWQRKLGQKVTCYPPRSLLKYATTPVTD